MSAATMQGDAAALPAFKQVIGHPGSLWSLFLAEFRERFAFDGIRWAARSISGFCSAPACCCC
jgi:POT family proton-dependent oligopeptide transporter